MFVCLGIDDRSLLQLLFSIPNLSYIRLTDVYTKRNFQEIGYLETGDILLVPRLTTESVKGILF